MYAFNKLVADLRSAIAPDRVLTGGPDYDKARRTFTANHNVTPPVIVRCRSVQDVQAGVRTAREHGVPLSVRGGGHDFSGRSVQPDALVLDLTALNKVVIDPERRVAAVGGGTLSSGIVAAAEPHGLTAVTGTAGSVGLAGLTLGGGYGPLIGLHGLAADNLLGAEVVLADGTLIDTDEDPELLWALRGGGGNFGVVTSMRVALHPVPTVLSGTILYPLAQAGTVLARLDEVLQDCPDDVEIDTGFVVGPDGSTMFGFLPTWSGQPGEAAQPPGTLDTLTKLGTPIVVDLARKSRSALLAEVDQMFPFNQRSGAIRTRSIPGMNSDLIPVFERAAASFTSGYSAILMHQFHGAAARVPLESTAFGRRTPHLMVEMISLWDPTDPNSARHLQWADQAAAQVTPHALLGGYVNLLGADDNDQIAHAYGTNTEKLLAIKARLDPDHVFTATPLPSEVPPPAADAYWHI